jgi:hypothetical protein
MLSNLTQISVRCNRAGADAVMAIGDCSLLRVVLGGRRGEPAVSPHQRRGQTAARVWGLRPTGCGTTEPRQPWARDLTANGLGNWAVRVLTLASPTPGLPGGLTPLRPRSDPGLTPLRPRSDPLRPRSDPSLTGFGTPHADCEQIRFAIRAKFRTIGAWHPWHCSCSSNARFWTLEARCSLTCGSRFAAFGATRRTMR